MKLSIFVLMILLFFAALGFARGVPSSGAATDGTDMEMVPAMMMEEEQKSGLLEFTDLEEIRGNIDRLEGIAVIVVNYDEESELKKKYGITYQHTYVQIDVDGEKLVVWNGGGVNGLLENTLKGAM